MKSALVLGRSDQLLMDLDRCLSSEGFAVTVTTGHEQFVASLNKNKPDAALLETRREAFVDLLKTVIRLAPSANVYLIDSGSVFCRYPMRGRQPDIVTALHKAGVRISDRLFTSRPAADVGSPPQQDPPAADAFLI